MINELPDPVLTQVYRLKAVVGAPQDFGDVSLAGDRRVVPLLGGTFTGPDLNGTLLPGGTVSSQIVLQSDRSAAEIRYTLRTDRGALLYVRSTGAGHGNREVAATRIETEAPQLEWLNTGVFVTVAGRTAVNMLYETYLVG